MLEVILDTETTGLSVKEKHRIVEIGCIELNNQIPTNKIFHEYIANMVYLKLLIVYIFFLKKISTMMKNICALNLVYNHFQICLVLKKHKNLMI